MSEVTLREITVVDSPLVVAWRNDPRNARWFPKQEPWTIEGHIDWYERTYLADPSQNVYLVLLDGAPVGTVGMTISEGQGELERMMLGNKNLAGGGYMRQGMRQLMSAYGLSHYWLRVMPDNEVTIRFHERNGFRTLSRDGGRYQNTLGEWGDYLIMTRAYDGYWPEVPERKDGE